MSIQEELHTNLSSVLETVPPLLTPTPGVGGDYAFHIKSAPELDKNSISALVKKLAPSPLIGSISLKEEFVNIHISTHRLMKELNTILVQKDTYGTCEKGCNKTVVIDYSSPNIAKRFSIGHLRSTIIGGALCRLYLSQGYTVIGDNHLGDWGTQFGKMIVAIREWADKPPEALDIEEMEALYVKFHKEAERDERLEARAREAFKRLEEGHEEERAMWKALIDRSNKEFDKVYALLGIHIEHALGESFYEDKMASVIEEAQRKSLAVLHDGALIFPFTDKTMPPGILLKTDGATTYFTRDLATVRYRIAVWSPHKIIYETGVEQTLHFRQVFCASQLLGWGNQDLFVHVAHGLIRGKEGKMSTRKGTTIKLKDVLEKAVEKAGALNPDKETARAIGVGAVIYNDLKRAPTNGYIFDWDEALNLTGNSGPYLQYAYARTQSILAKSKENSTSGVAFDTIALSPQERRILTLISRFPSVVANSALTHSPHKLCTYINEVASEFNGLYDSHPILKAEGLLKDFRLALTRGTGVVLKNGLRLLGIQPLSRI